MLIKGKRIRNLRNHLGWIPLGSGLRIAVPVGSFPASKWAALGFSADPVPGETLVPSGDLGPASAFNTNGKYQVHKDQPKETAYRVIEWTWNEWHGPYKVQKTDFRDLPYERYPRTLIPAPGESLQAAVDERGTKYVVSPAMTYLRATEPQIIHVVNLFLEIFGKCEVLDSLNNPMIKAQIRNLNWEVLPPGKYPWKSLEPKVRPLIDRQPEGNRHVISKRIERINSHEPEFVAVGRNGFSGYLVFGFPKKEIFVLESTHEDNATYVFGQDWETLSRMTKAEILKDDLHKARLVHMVRWFTDIEGLLGEPHPEPVHAGTRRR